MKRWTADSPEETLWRAIYQLQADVTCVLWCCVCRVWGGGYKDVYCIFVSQCVLGRGWNTPTVYRDMYRIVILLPIHTRKFTVAVVCVVAHVWTEIKQKQNRKKIKQLEWNCSGTGCVNHQYQHLHGVTTGTKELALRPKAVMEMCSLPPSVLWRVGSSLCGPDEVGSVASFSKVAYKHVMSK